MINKINNIILRKKGFRLFLLLVCSAVLTSCGDFLEEYSQDTAYVHGWSDLDELLLGSGYMQTGTPYSIGASSEVLSYPFYYPYIHLMGDEVDANINSAEGRTASYNSPEKYFGWYTWQQQVGLDPTGTTQRAEDTDWKQLYKNIGVCNMVINEIDDQKASTSNDELQKKRVKGEAYFLRGSYYFILANLYGKPYNPSTAASDLAVPIKLTEEIEDKVFNRNTVAEVYNQAESDLKEAESCLDGTTRKSYYHANKTAAELMLSRLYLYKQDYKNAADYAKKVIDAGDNHLQDLNALSDNCFLNPKSPEIIFTMGTGGVREWVSGWNEDFGVTSFLASLYQDENDLRSQYFVKYNKDYNYWEYVKGGSLDQLNTMGRTAPSHVFLLRTAEAYLNLAEAAASTGDNNTALTALNTLRRNRLASSAYSDLSLSGDTLITYIRNERERELSLEGHRWFDLRRYSVSDVLPQTKTIRHSYTTYEWSWWTSSNSPVQTKYYEMNTGSEANTLPIPQEVIDQAGGAMQNNPRPARPAIETVNY